jgi:hypothetical protein
MPCPRCHYRAGHAPGCLDASPTAAGCGYYVLLFAVTLAALAWLYGILISPTQRGFR